MSRPPKPEASKLFKIFSLVFSVFFIFQNAVFAQAAELLPPLENQVPAINAGRAAAPESGAADEPSDSTAFLADSSPLRLEAASLLENGFDKGELIARGMDYFAAEFGTVEPISGYPFEGFNQRDFTQPTAIGFYAQLLAGIVNGDLASEHISASDAKSRLLRLADSLLTHQKNLGYRGLLPWLAFDGSKWTRRPGEFGEQVTLGDNANLSAALGAAIGALLKDNVKNDSTVRSIRSKLDTFLERQRPGYQYLYKADAGRFRRGWNFKSNSWVGGPDAAIDYFGDEFRGAVSFLAVRYGFSDSVYTSLERKTIGYILSNGEAVQSVMPFDGGAFQMLWPSLTMPETGSPELNTMLRNFVRIALDYSASNHLPGFLSASYSGAGEYAPNAGIPGIAANTEPRNTSVPSLYTLGAAYQIAPEEVSELLARIFAEYPGLVSAHGLWEGVNVSTGQIIEEQIAANVTTFILGLNGKGPADMTRYLESKDVLWRLDSLYRPETPLDLIADSANFSDYSARDGFFAAWTGGDDYYVTGENVHQVLSVFFQKGAQLSGKDLRIRYRSTTDIGAARLEFKENEGGILKVRHSVTLPLLNTGGEERDLLIELPAGLGLLNIQEAVLVIEQGGRPIDLALTELDAVPADFTDVITQARERFTWGEGGVTASAQGGEYRISSPSFTSAGTAFIMENAALSGGQLKIRFRSWTSTGKVTIEFKEQTASGLVTRLTLNNLVFGNTSGKEKELLVNLPVTADLENIDEIILLLEGGTGAPLDLTLTDFDVRLRANIDTLAQSTAVIAWGDYGITGSRTPEGYRLSGPDFANAYAAFIQAPDGVNYSGKTLQVRYTSASEPGPLLIQFKESTPEGPVTRYAAAPVILENTGGGERTAVIRLPELLELFNIHEVVMVLEGGNGGPLDLTFTEIRALEQSSLDLLKDSSLIAASGSRVAGTQETSGYKIQTSRFMSASAVFTQDNAGIQGARQIRLRYKASADIKSAAFQLKVRTSSGSYSTVLQTAAVPLAGTGGEEREVVIRLGDNLNLLGVDQIALILGGSTGAPLDFTITELEIL